jgi:hypothetical protein
MIKMVLKKIIKMWSDKGFEICLGLCVASLIIFALYNKFKGSKGTYSKPGQYFVQTHNERRGRDSKNIISRGPPRESKGEAECRRVLQRIFKKPFPSKRPDFLRNPVTGGSFNLELDCYNSNLGLAVEYNGIQHYKYTPYFHRSKDHFMNQKYRDDMKKRICKENNIVLIEVPYTVKFEKIREFLVGELRKNGYLK